MTTTLYTVILKHLHGKFDGKNEVLELSKLYVKFKTFYILNTDLPYLNIICISSFLNLNNEYF